MFRRNNHHPAARACVTSALLLAAATPAPARSSPQQAEASFADRVDLGTVRVTVADARRAPIADLQAGEFRLSVNGRDEEVVVFLNESDAPLEVAVVLDTSGSIERDVSEIRPLMRELLAAFAPEDCVLMLPFHEEIGPGYWNVDPRSFSETFVLGGSTRLYDAVLAGLAALGDEGRDVTFDRERHCSARRTSAARARPAVVVITDGQDTASGAAFSDVLAATWERQIPVVILGVGIGAGNYPRLDGDYQRRIWQASHDTARDLRELAAAGGGRFIPASKQDHAGDFRDILTTLRSSYLLGYRWPEPPRPGTLTWADVEVTVTRPDATVTAPEGVYISGYDPAGARQRIEEGRLAFDAGDFRAALERFDRAVVAYRESPRAHYYKALTSLELGDLASAGAAVHWATFLDPRDPAIAALADEIGWASNGGVAAMERTDPVAVWIDSASHSTIARQQVARRIARMVTYRVSRSAGVRVVPRPQVIDPPNGLLVRIRDIEANGEIKAELASSNVGISGVSRRWFTLSAADVSLQDRVEPPEPPELTAAVDELVEQLLSRR
jgi:VWFA-related protein